MHPFALTGVWKHSARVCVTAGLPSWLLLPLRRFPQTQAQLLPPPLGSFVPTHCASHSSFPLSYLMSWWGSGMMPVSESPERQREVMPWGAARWAWLAVPRPSRGCQRGRPPQAALPAPRGVKSGTPTSAGCAGSHRPPFPGTAALSPSSAQHPAALPAGANAARDERGFARGNADVPRTVGRALGKTERFQLSAGKRESRAGKTGSAFGNRDLLAQRSAHVSSSAPICQGLCVYRRCQSGR